MTALAPEASPSAKSATAKTITETAAAKATAEASTVEATTAKASTEATAAKPSATEAVSALPLACSRPMHAWGPNVRGFAKAREARLVRDLFTCRANTR
jgi:hypothetical protein